MSVRVKLSSIIDGMDLLTDEMTSYLNTETGEVFSIMNEAFRAVEEEDDSLLDLFELEKEEVKIATDILSDENGGKYISLPGKFEIHEWAIMRKFCDSVGDQKISQSLLNAIHGRGAFRMFKDSIHRLGIADQWYKYRDNAIKNIAIEWCQENDIEYLDE
jgi:hypothetical protein